jgi:predicted AlkP superfamily pyrophosphatase or phosphodiesterase
VSRRGLGAQLVTVGVFALLMAAPGGLAQTVTPPDTNHVVVISLDGFTARALQDPGIPLPHLRRLAAAGAVARSMTPVNPTVTWANHTSMITGVPPAGHGVVYNGLLVREAGVPPRTEPWRDRDEMVHAPTLYDRAVKSGLTTAQVDWVAIWNAPTITWEFRERPDPANPISREMVAAGLVQARDVEEFGSRNIVFRDRVWTDAAAHILRTHKPNLMLFHLLALDSVQHRYGPDTLAAQETMAHLDAQVGEIVAAVADAGILERTTFVVVSDHGFKRVKRQINPNAALASAGLVSVTDGKATRAKDWVVPEGGTAIAYVTVPDPDGSRLARMRSLLAGIEGVDRIVGREGFAELGLPQPSDTGQMGPLLLVAKDGYAFTAAAGDAVVNDASEGSLGAHGYLASDPELGAIFIASGRGIRPGVVMESMRTLDIAPTLARLLGVDFPGAAGRARTEILSIP